MELTFLRVEICVRIWWRKGWNKRSRRHATASRARKRKWRSLLL